jgi:glycosyltransferase involved in cell wall biosynthesis
MKLNVVLRTCDKTSLASNRIVPKDECVKRCYKSLINSLLHYNNPFTIHVIDDDSSIETKQFLNEYYPNAIRHDMVIDPNATYENLKQKSRVSLKIALDYINQLPDDELVYLVEDDYLHYYDSIFKMIQAYDYFSHAFPLTTFGIFPQDFNQLYPFPLHQFDTTYVRNCLITPGPDRYYRTTWFTHESFLIPVSLFKKYPFEFYSLLNIGTAEGAWEGSTISNVWQKPEVKMMMPLRTLAIHMGGPDDLSFFVNDMEYLWEQNKIS